MFAARVSTSCASYGALGRWGGGGICPPPAQQARGAKQPRQKYDMTKKRERQFDEQVKISLSQQT